MTQRSATFRKGYLMALGAALLIAVLISVKDEYFTHPAEEVSYAHMAVHILLLFAVLGTGGFFFTRWYYSQTKMPLPLFHFHFRTSHHQFYVCDKREELATDAPDFWTQEASDERMAVGDGVIGVGLASYANAKGQLQFVQRRNDMLDFSAYDHVVEGSLHIASGVLQIQSCDDAALHLQVSVPPGMYRLRVYGCNFASVNDNEEGEDCYKMEMWPEAMSPRKVFKQG